MKNGSTALGIIFLNIWFKVNADIPAIETIFVEAPDLVTTELGVKGIGELPMVGVAAAIAMNRIANCIRFA